MPEAALRPQDDLGTASKNGLKRPLMVSNIEKAQMVVYSLTIWPMNSGRPLKPLKRPRTASKNGLSQPQAASDDLKRPLMVSNLEKGRFSFKNLEISSPRQKIFLKFQNFKIV